MNTKDKIIKNAAKLFAKQGFQKTTIKQIARDANVNIAAINYHFGSKYALIEKVVEQIYTPINNERIKKLNIIKVNNKQKDISLVKGILRAFIEPPFTAEFADKDTRFLLALSYQIFLERDKKIITYFMLQFKKPLCMFFQLLSEALPYIPKNILSWRVHFTIGVAINAMKILILPFPIPEMAPMPIANIDELIDQIIEFSYAGIISTTNKI
ncbi:MAG: TetR/AcrR family transcriptional regulator [Deferribacterota bacterium]|nr:TetR/AcrR family transcriptional regulator [Deferribacterota bacterium]